MFTLIAQAPPVPAPVPGTSANMLNILGQAPTITPIQTIGRLIEIGADAILLLGTLAVLVYLFLGAFKWLTAGGEKGKIEEARNMITQAIVGIVILAAVFAIYSLVLSFLGLEGRINLGGNGGAGNGTGTPSQVVGQPCGPTAQCIPPLFCGSNNQCVPPGGT